MYKLSKKKFPRTLEGLKEFNNTRYFVKFDLIHFQRNYRRFFKFSIISVDCFYLHSKISSHSLFVIKIDEDRFIATYSLFGNRYEFTATTNREFVEKLIKHNII